jgi:hypothetical protein
LVNEEIFSRLNRDRWLRENDPITGSYCAYRKEHTGKKPNRKTTTIYMSREVLGLPRNPGHSGDVADHKNHDIRENTKENLRPATRSQNRMNQINYNNEFKGVFLHRKKHVAHIRVSGSSVKFTSVSIKVEAALMYNYGADLVYGEYAELNIIPEDEMPTVERQWELYYMVIAQLRKKNVLFDESRIAVAA